MLNKKTLSLIIAIIASVFYYFQKPESISPPSPDAAPVIQVSPDHLPNTPGSFSKAKTQLYKEVYAGHEKTFYCGCDFDRNERSVDLNSCGLQSLQDVKRAQRIEAEHAMPAYHFGQQLQCWQEPEKVCPREAGKKPYSGRDCCMKASEVFKTAHNDLHNLYPAVGEINGERSNYRWAMLSGPAEQYGQCEIKIDKANDRAEPPANVRGDIARTYFYMQQTYGFAISAQQRQLFAAWSTQDPPDAWEKERNQRIAKIQGQDNPFITNY